MKAVKISLVVVAALFCFALGLSLRPAAPEASRDVASVKDRHPTSRYDNRVSAALKNCLAEGVGPSGVKLGKKEVDGRNWAIAAIDCSGPRAKALYESLGPYTNEQYVRLSDGRSGVARFFGRLYPPSTCLRLIKGVRGTELNSYTCFVRIDLDHELIDSLNL